MSDVVILRRESVVTVVRGGPSSPVIQQTPAPTLIIKREGIAGPSAVALSVIGINLDAGVQEISPGVKTDVPVEHDQLITGWTIVADQVGDIELDILATTYAAFPAGFVSIVGATPPKIVNGDKAEGDAADWTKNISKDMILRYVVQSADTIRRATVTLNVEKG